MEAKMINEIIRKRRAVFPPMYSGTPIEKEVILEILENANWAPTHKKTEPWRFKIITGKSLERLSKFQGDFYKNHTPEDQFSEKKYEKTIRKPLQCACVIAICMQRDPDLRVPEWEEIAAVACAVQNMWLSASAHGIGAYWSTPKSIYAADEFLDLKKGEQCLGFFYMGNYEGEDLPGARSSIESKLVWMD